MTDHERRDQDVVTPPEGYVSDPADEITAIFGDGAFDAEPEPADEEEDLFPRVRPKIKWLRLAALLSGLGLLAIVSTVFGMMMAVASDLPEIDVLDVAPNSSKIVDRHGKDLGVLTGNQNRILVDSKQIAPVMKHAIVAIEDRRFYTNSGVDIRGIARALYQDVVAKKAVQGGSTIAQQLVKNRLEAQDSRTLFQKLREAAMAFHMTRKWDKERILRNYLNTIYFGNGAYGIESAARTYFGFKWGVETDNSLCGSRRGLRRCAELLEPQDAALLAGVVASPSAYDPIAHPAAAKERRDVVLGRMLAQGYLTQPQHDAAVEEPIPTPEDINPPQETSKYPYFTTWVRQQVVDKVGAGRAFEGGLRVETTIDSELQESAQAAVNQMTAIPGAPAAALVAIQNDSSEVLAMVGNAPGQSYNERPFNLATQGQRQPGSSFKPFTLATALTEGVDPNSTWSSRKKTFCVTRRKGRCTEAFEVNNYDDNYAGISTLANATAFSDNSVYAELGIKIGTKKIARMARRIGVRTPVSSNLAMTLGGLSEGVTPLDMAHAYETFANDGRLTYGTLSPGVDNFDPEDPKATVPGPVGIREITRGKKPAELLTGGKGVNKTRETRVLKPSVAADIRGMLQGVVRYGSGKRAGLGADVFTAGKTGTTEDYGDAWFVGWTDRITVAVWVGYPDELRAMEPPTFSYQGDPVAGGTWPAAIWNTFMKSALAIYERRNPPKDGPTGPTGPITAPAPSTTTAPATEDAPATTKKKPKAQPTPQQEQPAEPAPPVEEPTAPPDNGGGVAPEEGGAEPPDPGATAPENP